MTGKALTILTMILMTSCCGTKDWYIHLRGKIEVPVDVTIGRGESHTVQKISTEDSE